ncbi:TetR/AcrR family transcriptional regulator [Brachybacterium sacelli]|uniref:AcrR family transcriptional regulator n=1 Tax=Brachybacterium sacelli TaxID=173364 RepID=A0ABS4WYV8_9MICO|nr:TetR/AcrR family transcriptional regulator [Brachybacterium sacelli]MBP2380694.1 AcrR family transcriptional regulator [Brachybacterium sacelli]
MSPVAPARDRLLEAAHELFYAHGIAATGIDTITAHAGVARKSLYNNFASKDDLVSAYLEDRHQLWLTRFAARRREASTPREQVLAVFDAYIDHAEAEHLGGFRGCGLLNAAAELPAGSLGRSTVRRHKEEVEDLLCGMLTETRGEAEARQLAEHLSFLLEGAVSRAGLEGTAERLRRARAIAESLVAAR